MIRKRRLFTPGPTPLFPAASVELSREIIHHRTEEFRRIFEEVRSHLRYFFQTDDDVVVLCSSGSGAMEAAVINLFAPGDSVAIVNGGKFGERWMEIAHTFGLDVIEIFVERGKAVTPEKVEDVLKSRAGVRGLLWQDCETSTGVRHPTRDLAERFRNRGLLLVVDAITGLGAHEFETGAWGLDAVISASQKALGLPPGLAFISLSRRAGERMASVPKRSYYFDLERELKCQQRNDPLFTPAISLIIAARAVLSEVKGIGLRSFISNAAVAAEMTRLAVLALGLELYAETPADSITAVKAPPGKSSQELIRALDRDFGIVFADGQEELKGKIFRVTHMGYVDFIDTLGAIAALEHALRSCAVPIEAGAGTRAASDVLARHMSGKGAGAKQ